MLYEQIFEVKKMSTSKASLCLYSVVQLQFKLELSTLHFILKILYFLVLPMIKILFVSVMPIVNMHAHEKSR